MASSVSNLSICMPFSSNSEKIRSITGRGHINSIRARIGGSKDNLDHLQRVPLPQQQQQMKPNRRAAPASPIGLWDRFPTARTVQQMMDTMDRLMDDPFAYSTTKPSVPTNERDEYGRGRTPWEIKEREEDYKVRFDMPGMTKNDVKVWVEGEGSMLVVRAEKGTQDSLANGRDEAEEWPAKSYGKYSFRIALPENVEFEKIKAEVKDGVLYVTIPKASTTSKIIDIDVK